MEKKYAMSDRMTSIEAYRALSLLLDKWHERCPDDECLAFYANYINKDRGIRAEWEEAVEQMIEERREFGNKYHAFEAGGGVYHACKCQDEDTNKDSDTLMAERNIPR